MAQASDKGVFLGGKNPIVYHHTPKGLGVSSKQITEEEKLQISIWHEQKSRSERLVGGVFTFNALKHRSILSWARLKSYMHHTFINLRLDMAQ